MATSPGFAAWSLARGHRASPGEPGTAPRHRRRRVRAIAGRAGAPRTAGRFDGGPSRADERLFSRPACGPPECSYTRACEEARSILVELGEEAGLVAPDAQVIAGIFAARTSAGERARDHRGHRLGLDPSRLVGRLLPSGVGERLLTGAACLIPIAPRDYAEIQRSGLRALAWPSTGQMSRTTPRAELEAFLTGRAAA